MSGKRKFSASFERDLDITQSLLKYRKTSTPICSTKVSSPRVSQEDLRSMIDKFVSIYEQLDTRNSADMKPNYTYTEMIFVAVMRSPNFCLPITEIYRYIQTRFAFFKETTNPQWKNAVRHSLSKTKCFQKIGLKNQKPRNGILNRSAFLWTILPRSLLSFARGDYRPTNKFSGSNSLRTAFNQINAGGLWEACVTTLMERQDAFQNILDQSPSPAKLFQLQVCNMECGIYNLSVAGKGNQMPYHSRASGILNIEFNYTDCNPQSAEIIESSCSMLSLNCHKKASPTSTNSHYDSYDTPERVDSSGYLSCSEISSPESGNKVSWSCQWSSLNLTQDYSSGILTDDTKLNSIPEVKPECIYNVPAIPFLPPLKLSFDDVITDNSYTCYEDINSLDQNYIRCGQDNFTNSSVMDTSVLQGLLYV